MRVLSACHLVRLCVSSRCGVSACVGSVCRCPGWLHERRHRPRASIPALAGPADVDHLPIAAAGQPTYPPLTTRTAASCWSCVQPSPSFIGSRARSGAAPSAGTSEKRLLPSALSHASTCQVPMPIRIRMSRWASLPPREFHRCSGCCTARTLLVHLYDEQEFHLVTVGRRLAQRYLVESWRQCTRSSSSAPYQRRPDASTRGNVNTSTGPAGSGSPVPRRRHPIRPRRRRSRR
jgi:hypothetical protein